MIIFLICVLVVLIAGLVWLLWPCNYVERFLWAAADEDGTVHLYQQEPTRLAHEWCDVDGWQCLCVDGFWPLAGTLSWNDEPRLVCIRVEVLSAEKTAAAKNGRDGNAEGDGNADDNNG